MAQKTVDPKDTIRRLLEALTITRVIYVDDVFAITRENVQAQCNDLSLAELEKSCVFPDVDFTIDDEDVVRAQVLARVERFGREELVATAPKLVAEASRTDAIRDFEAATKFGELLQGFDLLCLSRARWLAQRRDLLSTTPSEQTLFVFDEDFRGEGQATDEGRRLVAQLQADLGGAVASFALLTHTVADEASELRLQKSIVEVFPQLEDRVIVVAKRRLAQEEEGFAWRLKLAVLNRYFVQLKTRLTEAVANATSVASDAVQQLHVDAFERIVFRSSSREGVWAPETLVRIFGIYFEKSIFGSIRGDTVVHELAEKSRQISHVETAAISQKTWVESRRLQRTAIYADADDLNRLHLPIELGDIFEADGTRFILIAQPCDLMVREREGLRRNKASDDRQMVPLAALESRRRKAGEKKAMPAEEFDLPIFEDQADEMWRAKLNDTFVIPIWLLDLAAFHPEGRCELRAGASPSPLLVPAWQLRHHVLLQRVKGIVSRHNAICAHSANDASEILGTLLGVPNGLSNAAVVEPTETRLDGDWCLYVGLQRVARLREPYASAMLTKYGHWMTRSAYPQDLTRLD